MRDATCLSHLNVDYGTNDLGNLPNARVNGGGVAEGALGAA